MKQYPKYPVSIPLSELDTIPSVGWDAPASFEAISKIIKAIWKKHS